MAKGEQAPHILAMEQRIENYSDEKLLRVAWAHVYFNFGERAINLMVKDAHRFQPIQTKPEA